MRLTSAAAAIVSVIAAPVSQAGDDFATWTDLSELDVATDLSVDLTPVGMGTPMVTIAQDYHLDGDFTGKLILDLLPGGLLLSPDVDGFTVVGPGIVETIDGVASGILTLSLGLAIDTTKVSYDIEIGGGVLYNSAFTSGLFVIDFTPRFKLGDNITLGPHVGLMYFFEPSWYGTTPVTLSDATGFMVGGSFTAGSPKVSFSLMFDYLFGAESDVSVPAPFTAPSELDLSGFLLRAGVILKF